MFNDHFKYQYTTLPVATYHGNYSPDTIPQNGATLYHNHRELEILLINRGRATFFIGSEAYEAEKGDIVIVPPYALHNTVFDKESGLEQFCICFDVKILSDDKLGKELENGLISPAPIIKNDDENATTLAQCIKSAFDAQIAKPEGWELIVSGNLSVFWGLLISCGKICKSPAAKSDICYPIMDFIEKNHTKSITSSHVADALHMSKSYFCKVFKAKFGSCFQNYLCMFRLEKAKILLKTTDLPISDISARVGFNSFSFFSKMFREYLGITPSEYKKSV